MVANMNYYRMVRKTDPSYTPREAVREYLGENKDVAVRICQDLGLDDMPFGFDDLGVYLRGKDPIDVLAMGIYCTKPFDFNGYFQFEGDGNLRSMNEREYLKWCVDKASEYADEIYDGKISVPAEMKKVLDLWRTPRSEIDVVYPSSVDWFYNKKSSPTKKTVKKAPVKKKASSKKVTSKATTKKAPAKKNTCSTRKTSSKNIKAKAPVKKRASR